MSNSAPAIPDNFRIKIAGEDGLIIYPLTKGCNLSSQEVTLWLRAAQARLRQLPKLGLVDTVIGYASLLLVFDPFETDHFAVRKAIKVELAGIEPEPLSTTSCHKLAVYYHQESGPDLARVAAHAKMSEAEVIACHQQQEYRVFAIGFSPGFAFLGEVDPKLATPRLASPRQRVPWGSVAIADQQTAVYPSDSPGGWNLIGRCPERLFNPGNAKASPFAVGDKVQFYAVSREQYLSLGGEL